MGTVFLFDWHNGVSHPRGQSVCIQNFSVFSESPHDRSRAWSILQGTLPNHSPSSKDHYQSMLPPSVKLRECFFSPESPKLRCLLHFVLLQIIDCMLNHLNLDPEKPLRVAACHVCATHYASSFQDSIRMALFCWTLLLVQFSSWTSERKSLQAACISTTT